MKGGNSKRDAHQGAGVESGTSSKMKMESGVPKGMGAVGKNQKPEANPRTSAARGHTLN